ncbi:alcohol dehydrogenase [Aureococcus anophagefferens]|uniref:Alcohol dehydrogenase n=1 Tax=Aureococcus anophagefferens TaxID=44056 RepID=A0ABR1FWC9_AURAN
MEIFSHVWHVRRGHARELRGQGRRRRRGSACAKGEALVKSLMVDIAARSKRILSVPTMKLNGKTARNDPESAKEIKAALCEAGAEAARARAARAAGPAAPRAMTPRPPAPLRGSGEGRDAGDVRRVRGALDVREGAGGRVRGPRERTDARASAAKRARGLGRTRVIQRRFNAGLGVRGGERGGLEARERAARREAEERAEHGRAGPGLGLPWPLPTYDAPDAPAATRGDDGSLELDARAALAERARAARDRREGTRASLTLPEDSPSLLKGVIPGLVLYPARLCALLARTATCAAEPRAGVRRPGRAATAAKLAELGEAGLVAHAERRDWALREFPTGTRASEAESEAAVDAALAYLRSRPKGPGVHVDSAEAYRNEAAIGRAIAKDPATASRLFLASKISDEKSLGYEGARRRVQETLRNFGVDRVDLYYLHSPFGFNRGEKTRVADAWRALVELRDAGTIGALGLSNFNARDLRQFANDADLGGLRMPDVVQNKFDPYRRGDQSPAERDDVVGLCATLGVAVVAYSQLSGWPFGVGALADPLLAQIAAANGASVASVVSKWVLDAGHAAIPRSSNASHVRANLAVLDAWPAPLAPAERAAIDGLNHLVAFRENVAAGPDALGVKAASKPGRAEL